MKVSATKAKVVRSTIAQFLGFTFYKNGENRKCMPTKDRKKRLYEKIKVVLSRRYCIERALSTTFAKINQIVRGWINYFKIRSIKQFGTKEVGWKLLTSSSIPKF